MKLTFLGAARNVTGSSYLVEANNVRLLVDAGLYQEREFRSRNWEPFPVPPDTIDCVLLTHAHLDHCGLLPKLARQGFRGDIHCTAATAEIAQIMLADSAKIQEEDAEFKRRRHEREGRQGPHADVPLYTTADARECCSLLSPVPNGERVPIGDGVTATFHDAGHVLGASMIKLNISQGGVTRSIVFSGDVGRWNKPILNDPTVFEEADYVVVESTYGDRLHQDSDAVCSELAAVIGSTVEAGGNIVVPTFALERAQEILYYLNKLLMERRIPHMTVFLDSPMAVSITDVFDNHPELFDKEMRSLVRRGNSPFDFPGLTMVRSVEESKAINTMRGSAMIMAGSGMCTGGRIKHHLVANISRPESTVLFVGYQAEGTLGRQIVNGAREVRILGENRAVRARVVQMDYFSAHADRDELFRWLSGLRALPRQVFVVHGEEEAATAFADFLRERTGWSLSVPKYRDEVLLD